MLNTELNLIKAGTELGDEIFFDICDQHPMLDENDSRADSMLLSIWFNASVVLMLKGFPPEFLAEQMAIAQQAARDIDSD